MPVLWIRVLRSEADSPSAQPFLIITVTTGSSNKLYDSTRHVDVLSDWTHCAIFVLILAVESDVLY